MESRKRRPFSSLFHPEKVRLKQRIVVFTFFLVVSALLWFLSRLNSDYTTDVEYPMKLANAPRNMVVVGTPPKSITLRVSGFGYSLLRFKMAAPLSPLVIDLNQTPMQSLSEAPHKLFLPTTQIRSIIASQLSNDIHLASIRPDTLFVEFATMARKTLKVVPQFQFTLAKQHMQSEAIVMDPDTISISGPASILDTITTMQTLPQAAEGLDRTTTFLLGFNPIKQVGFSHRKIKLTVPVEKFTEIELEVPVKLRSSQSLSGVILLPPRVKLQCYVPISQVANMRPNRFNVFVDIGEDELRTGNRKARVQMGASPPYIRIADFEPKFVEFYFEKR